MCRYELCNGEPKYRKLGTHGVFRGLSCPCAGEGQTSGNLCPMPLDCGRLVPCSPPHKNLVSEDQWEMEDELEGRHNELVADSLGLLLEGGSVGLVM